MPRRLGLSIIELIVVLGIIAVLIGILFPAVQRVREAAQQTVCKNNLKQISLALSQYGELVGSPPSNPADVVGGWAIIALPFLEQSNLERQFPVGDALTVLDPQFHELPRIFRCPTQANARMTKEGVADAHYLLVALPGDKKRHVYGVVESPLNLNLPWASSPEITPVELEALPRNADTAHPGGYHYAPAFHDSVEFLRTQ